MDVSNKSNEEESFKDFPAEASKAFEDSFEEDSPIKKKGTLINWTFLEKLENLEPVKVFLERESTWGCLNNKMTAGGEKVYYRYKAVEKTKKCPAQMHLFYYADGTGVGVFTNKMEHQKKSSSAMQFRK